MEIKKKKEIWRRPGMSPRKRHICATPLPKPRRQLIPREETLKHSVTYLKCSLSGKSSASEAPHDPGDASAYAIQGSVSPH